MHVLGPLFDSYEITIAQLHADLKNAKFLLQTQLEDCKIVILENDQLREQLETTKREYLSIISQGDIGNKDSSASMDEVMELKNRAHLLTEEN